MIKQLLFAGGILAAGSAFSQQGLEKIIGLIEESWTTWS